MGTIAGQFPRTGIASPSSMRRAARPARPSHAPRRSGASWVRSRPKASGAAAVKQRVADPRLRSGQVGPLPQSPRPQENRNTSLRGAAVTRAVSIFLVYRIPARVGLGSQAFGKEEVRPKSLRSRAAAVRTHVTPTLAPGAHRTSSSGGGSVGPARRHRERGKQLLAGFNAWCKGRQDSAKNECRRSGPGGTSDERLSRAIKLFRGE